MKIRSLFLRFTSLAILIAAGGVVANAQSYYDDDIYYDASKAKKKAKSAQNKKPQQNNNGVQYYYDGAQYVPWTNVGEYEDADKHYVEGTSTRNVDEYNRRYTDNKNGKTNSKSSQQIEEYSNTRNLARFHNSQEAQQAYASSIGNDYYSEEDGTYEAYIAATQPETVINVNLIGIGSPYYNTSWYWNRWGYDPFWGYAPYWGSSWGYWGPSWSWNWGWYSPSWAWSWGWCCHPHYYHHHHHHGWYPSHYHNYTSTGAYRPNVAQRHNGSFSNSTSGRFNRGSVNRSTSFGSRGIRKGYNSGNLNRNQTTTVTRPGYRQPTGNPNSTVNAGRGRGYFGSGKGTVNQNVQKQNKPNSGFNYNYNTNKNNSNRSNSYNSSRGRSSSSSFGRGSSGMGRGSSHSMGGGSHRNSGGGGHRGR